MTLTYFKTCQSKFSVETAQQTSLSLLCETRGECFRMPYCFKWLKTRQQLLYMDHQWKKHAVLGVYLPIVWYMTSLHGQICLAMCVLAGPPVCHLLAKKLLPGMRAPYATYLSKKLMCTPAADVLWHLNFVTPRWEVCVCMFEYVCVM